MTAEHPQGNEPLIPMPALSLPALRQAVAAEIVQAAYREVASG